MSFKVPGICVKVKSICFKKAHCISYSGNQINATGLYAADAKTEAIIGAPPPQNIQPLGP